MPMFRHSGQPWRRLCECASTSAARQSFVLHEATPRACVCTHELFFPQVLRRAFGLGLTVDRCQASACRCLLWCGPSHQPFSELHVSVASPKTQSLSHNLLCMMSAAARAPADQTSRSWAEPAHTNSGRSAQSPWPDRASLKHASELLFL